MKALGIISATCIAIGIECVMTFPLHQHVLFPSLILAILGFTVTYATLSILSYQKKGKSE